MDRVRVFVHCHPTDRAENLRRISRIKRDLYSHSPVEVDPDDPRFATHRWQDGRAYFEFSTDFVNEARRVLQEYGHNFDLSKHAR